MINKIGVKVISPALDYSGYAESSRNLLMALNKVGVGLTTANVHYQSLPLDLGESGRLAAESEGKQIDYNKIIIETTPDNFHRYLEPMKYHIGRFYWETDKLHENFVWGCNHVDEIWISTPSHKKSFVKDGVKVPIVSIPDCMDTSFKRHVPYRIREHKGFLFYSMFQWTPRKNPEALVKTYWKTFEGKEDVSLLLKTYRVDFSPEEKNAIRNDIDIWKSEMKLKHYPRLLLCLNPMGRNEIMRLHATGDCFVSAHRGEGWGYPQMEAMVSGKPIISTNYEGIHEWINDSVGWLLPYKLVPVSGMNWIPWYKDDQNWAEVDTKALAQAMRTAYTWQGKTREKGKAARKMVEEKFSYEAVGKLILKRLKQI